MADRLEGNSHKLNLGNTQNSKKIHTSAMLLATQLKP